MQLHAQAEQLLSQYEDMRKKHALLFYKPHPKQDAFHRAGKFKRRYARTGNRFGKSELGAAEDVAWALGYRPWYPEGDPARYEGIPRHSVKGLVICQDWDKVHEIFTNQEPGTGMGKIMKFVPQDALAAKPVKSKSGVVAEVKVKNIWGGVSSIFFDTVKSFLVNPMGQESSDWDFIHVDEPCPEDMWKANARGLVDRDGSAWFTCTPLSYMWINDKFVPRSKMREDPSAPIIDEASSLWMVTGSMHDNPHLSDAAKQRFLDDLSPNERQCRESGIPLALSGVIYKQFNYSKHVFDEPPLGWKDLWTPPENYTIRYTVDPHPEQPHAVLFAATAPTGEVFFYNELFEQCLASTLCERIHGILHGRWCALEMMDPLGFKESPTDGSSMASIFDEHGLFVEPAPKDLARGIIQTQMELDKEIRLPSGTRTPKLRFSTYLTETLWEFDHYEWDPNKHNKPIDKDDHMMENLYRLVISGLDYVSPETAGSPILSNPHAFSNPARL